MIKCTVTYELREKLASFIVDVIARIKNKLQRLVVIGLKTGRERRDELDFVSGKRWSVVNTMKITPIRTCKL